MKLAAIVLAAGSATRFGSDKLSALFRGRPIIHHAIEAARAAPVSSVIVVKRPGLAIGTWPSHPPVEAIDLESKELSQSLKAGIAAASDVDGVFVFLGDMPLVPHRVAGRLAEIIGHHFAAVPICKGKPGHPVLLSATAFEGINRLEGDEGAGKLLRQRDDVIFDECSEPNIHRDIDRPEDLSDLQNEMR